MKHHAMVVCVVPCSSILGFHDATTWIILGALAAPDDRGELLVRPWNPSKGCVQIVNQGDATMDDLVVAYGETKVRVGAARHGQSTNVWFTAAGKGTLSLEFNQKGNPVNGFQVQDSTRARISRTVSSSCWSSRKIGSSVSWTMNRHLRPPEEPEGHRQPDGLSPRIRQLQR